MTLLISQCLVETRETCVTVHMCKYFTPMTKLPVIPAHIPVQGLNNKWSCWKAAGQKREQSKFHVCCLTTRTVVPVGGTGGSSQICLGNSAKTGAQCNFASFVPLLGCHFSNIFNKLKPSVESIVIIGIYHNCQSRCAGKTHLSCLN